LLPPQVHRELTVCPTQKATRAVISCGLNPPGDENRGDYQKAYAAATGRCSTTAAPWYVVPANRKWYRHWAVAQLLIETTEDMKLTGPHPHLDVRALKKSLLKAA
jgi:hypothetical protein